MSNQLKIDLSLPQLSIEEQLHAKAHLGKCAMIWWSADGSVTTWCSSDLNYYEKLFIMDSFRQRFDEELKARRDDDED